MRTAYHRVQMAPDGREIVRAMRLAIERSGRSPDEIGHVNYHGTSTQMNDAVESRSVRELFGRRADLVPRSSTKSMVGHPQGASGALGIVMAALAPDRGVLPPTINLEQPDPGCEWISFRVLPVRDNPWRRSAIVSVSVRRTARSYSAAREAGRPPQELLGFCTASSSVKI